MKEKKRELKNNREVDKIKRISRRASAAGR